MIFVTISLLLLLSVDAASYDCDYIDMGFNLIQPVNECVVGKERDDGLMSIKYVCIDDDHLVESRIYKNTINCDNDDYYVVTTFECNSDRSFVKCSCSFYNDDNNNDKEKTSKNCPIIKDIEYSQYENGSCDTSKINQYRVYIADPNEIPEPLEMDNNNCFERVSDNYC